MRKRSHPSRCCQLSRIRRFKSLRSRTPDGSISLHTVIVVMSPGEDNDATKLNHMIHVNMQSKLELYFYFEFHVHVLMLSKIMLLRDFFFFFFNLHDGYLGDSHYGF